MRPNKVVGFAQDSLQGKYLPVEFGTEKFTKNLDKIANHNFALGLESLEGQIQAKDLNTVFYYYGMLLKHLYEKGVAEFSTYQNYPKGSIVHYDNKLWINKDNVKASQSNEDEEDNCHCCSTCEIPEYPSEQSKWCEIATVCDINKIKQVMESELDTVKSTMSNLELLETVGVITSPVTNKNNLVFTFTNKEPVLIPMSMFGGLQVEGDKVVFNNPDGAIVELPDFRKENDVIKLNTGSIIKEEYGLSLKDGKLVIDENFINKLTKPLKDSINSLNTGLDNLDTSVHTTNDSGLIGNGTNDNPLKLNVSDDFKVINGKLSLVAKEPATVTDLNNLSTPLRRMGETYFKGFIDVSGRKYVIGVPSDFEKEEPQMGTTDMSEIVNTTNYDFNGWQLASSAEVQQYITNAGITWERTNDFGMKQDGSLVNPTGWTRWVRSTNVLLNTESFNSLVDEVNKLKTSSGNLTSSLNNKENSLLAKLNELENKLNSNKTFKICFSHSS